MLSNKAMTDKSLEQTEFEGEQTLDPVAGNSFYNDEEKDSAVYPDAQVNIVAENASVFQLKRKFDKEPPLLKLDPDFQRHEVWGPRQKSELIESILMGIPLPLIYLKEDSKGVSVIVDGRQRLSTLFKFMNNEFALQNLRILNDLNGAYFSKVTRGGKVLNPAQQSKIEDCSLTLHVIKPPTKDRVTFDLFDRVNRGGTRLNNQEMRNAIYQGPATRFLRKLSAMENFKAATENSIKPDRMKDTYLILRLAAFYLWRRNELVDVKESNFPKVEYKSDLENLLGKTMEFLNDNAGAKVLEEFPDKFDMAMNNAVEFLQTGCFRLPKVGDGPRRPINMALFESISYLLILLENYLPKMKDELSRSYNNLINDEKFINSLTYTVDSNSSVAARFSLVEQEADTIKLLS
jgi:hypothetical protein